MSHAQPLPYLSADSPALGVEAAKKRVSILGCSGSVGTSTLEVIAHQRALHGLDACPIEALVCRSNVAALIQQARQFRPKLAVIADPALGPTLQDALAGTGIETACGPEAVLEAAARESDWVMAAIVGAAGLEPTLSAVRRGAQVALASKESLVCAGAVFSQAVKDAGATLLPVDSEHNAIFQVFDAVQSRAVESIILTASGGPFRAWSLEQMAGATPAQAVAHPNWDMGAKISVDSASMMNKGLELIEAAYLFDMPQERIDVVVHPESVVHSLVAYADGSVLAQLGPPDMKTPIAHALGYPERIETPGARLNLAQVASLHFEAPDEERFPALRLARHALIEGGAAPTVLNSANEVAVAAFLEGRLGFLEIAHVVEETLEGLAACWSSAPTDLAEVLAVDREGRALAREIAARKAARRG